MRISVIIPTYQRRDLVVEAVCTLLQQDFRDSFEVIVVVDGSVDGTGEALRQINSDIPLTVLEQGNLGQSKARNMGANQALGEILLFLDDDMIAQPDLLSRHDKAHNNQTDMVLGHIPVHPDSPANFLSAAVGEWAEERLDRLSQPGAKLLLEDLIIGQASISREIFTRLGGFDCDFTRAGTYGNEDLEFCHRLQTAGYHIVFNPDAISWQKYIVTPRQHLHQWHQAGKADTRFARKHPELIEDIFPSRPGTTWLHRLARPSMRWLTLSLLESGWQNPWIVQLFFRVRQLEYNHGVYTAGGIPGHSPLRILSYHAVADLGGSRVIEQYGVPADLFRTQLRTLLSAGYHFVNTTEFLAFLKGRGVLPRRSLLLTFDDCYENLLGNAVPILKELNIPAIAFAVSGRLGRSNDWDEKIGAPALPLLNAEGLKELNSHRVEIGCHSRTHRPLRNLSNEELKAEVMDSIHDLEANGLHGVRLFAYPYGEHDQRVRNAIQIAGIEAAMTVKSGAVKPGDHPYQLPRIEIMRRDGIWKLRWKLACAGHLTISRARSTRSTALHSRVSVIVPAYNAEKTLPETLASIKAQTFPAWEAIIVDDGSNDSTAAIAREWSKLDNRFRLITQANGGEGAARNTGLHAAQNDWLIFLDADDWIAPEYMEKMLHKLARQDELDGIVCGCVRVTPAGVFTAQAVYEPWYLDNLFPQFARDCPFAIHNCMVRRSLAIEIGGFDTSLITCADWDFWQRMARSGCRFGCVADVLAFYRMRPGSSSSDAERVLLDGFTVIRRGYMRDPRVSHPHADYRDGLSTHDLPEVLFRHALWPASLLLSQGKDAVDLLAFMGDEQAPGLCAETVAKSLFDYIPLAAADTPAAWPALWPELSERLNDYLVALEAKSGVRNLAARAMRRLEQLILESMEFSEATVLGSSCGIHIDVSKPIRDETFPGGVEQAVIVVNASGEFIGSISIPICNATVPGSIIAEAIVADLAWLLIKQHFRLNLPEGSPLKSQLYYLTNETQPLRIMGRLLGVAYPLLHWQFREGVIKKPHLLTGLLRLFLKLKPVSLTRKMMNMSPDNRRSHLKETILLASQRMAREEFIAVYPASLPLNAELG